jgi:hypothetical protein
MNNQQQGQGRGDNGVFCRDFAQKTGQLLNKKAIEKSLASLELSEADNRTRTDDLLITK